MATLPRNGRGPIEETSMAKAMDTIFGHCVARALLTEAGIEPGKGVYGEGVSKWEAMRAAVRVTPKAMRVATFVVFWAVGMRELGQDSYSLAEYQQRWNESERTAFRLQREFRELWGEYGTPDQLAQQIVKHLDARVSAKEAAKLPMRVEVYA
jgi:hypothetical protein